jgi:hypothetical protein
VGVRLRADLTKTADEPASFTRVGHAADLRGLAPCCATMSCTLPHGIEFS